ncbi:unnamed protein product [Caenorhabditis brenneri]
MNRISVLVCEIIEEENTFIHKCFDFTETYNTKVIDKNLGANRVVGKCYTIGPMLYDWSQGGVDDLQSGFDLEVIDGVVHIKTLVFCFKKDCLKDGQENYGGLPFSRELGRVRDPQGRLKKSFSDGRQHTVISKLVKKVVLISKVIVRYAPVAGEPEAFEIADVFESVNGKEKVPPPENRNDEEDKENDKKKKPASKGKAGKAARRRAQRIP